MGWFGAVVKNLLWNIFRGLFNLIRALFWLLRCVYCKKSRVGSSYDGSVQCLKVWGRFKLDLVLQPSGIDNFILVNSSWENPHYVLQDTVTLYYINKKEAVFVECPEDVDVASSNFSPFVRIAQFRHARKVLVMPINVFHNLAEKIGDPDSKIVFISNTARCGSTLLTQIFEETGHSIAYSEPDAMNALSVLQNKVPEEEYDRITRNVVRVLCKPSKRVPDCICHIIKLTAPTMMYIPYLTRIFPNCTNFFMYRNGLPMCKSLDRCGYQMPLLGMLFFFGRKSVYMTKKMVKEMGLPPDNFAVKVKSRLCFSSIVWASTIDQYLRFRRDNINIVGVRYEDLVADPQFSVKQIFNFCDMPEEYVEGAATNGLNRDSQRESPLSRDKLKNHQAEVYDGKIQTQCEEVCTKFKLPNLDEDCVLECTITNKQQSEDGQHQQQQPPATLEMEVEQA